MHAYMCTCTHTCKDLLRSLRESEQVTLVLHSSPMSFFFFLFFFSLLSYSFNSPPPPPFFFSCGYASFLCLFLIIYFFCSLFFPSFLLPPFLIGVRFPSFASILHLLQISLQRKPERKTRGGGRREAWKEGRHE
jgi:hypothetical protein